MLNVESIMLGALWDLAIKQGYLSDIKLFVQTLSAGANNAGDRDAIDTVLQLIKLAENEQHPSFTQQDQEMLADMGVYWG